MVLNDDGSPWKSLEAADNMPYNDAQSDELSPAFALWNLNDPDCDSFLRRIERECGFLFQVACEYFLSNPLSSKYTTNLVLLFLQVKAFWPKRPNKREIPRIIPIIIVGRKTESHICHFLLD